MKVDTAITGGGLSALVCGIRLQRSGRKTVILSAGQNCLFFFSGAFGLLSRLPDGTAVKKPLEALASLPECHPYSMIGPERLKRYAAEVQPFFRSCGAELNGCGESNMWRYLSTGSTKKAWATLTETGLFSESQPLAGRKVLIINIPGFLDFFPKSIAKSLEKAGSCCRTVDVSIPETEALRMSSNVVRSIGLAKVFEQNDVLEKFIGEVSKSIKDEETIILPQLFGLKSEDALTYIRSAVPAEVLFFGTMTPSVPGNRLFSQLKAAYEEAGGCFISGSVRSASVEAGKVPCLYSDPLDEPLEADDFVLATGSFVSKGLISSPDSVSEPIFGLDVKAGTDRSEWYCPDAGAKQDYLGYGVITDRCFHPSINGKTVRNLYAAGSVLAGSNSLYEGSGAGTAIFTAMQVADLILER